ncbi:hypothetical protein AX16_003533 [Volvariella volvacea WC 439]|nr:hypothetical protein AX16_003533 [Volvariella volvacea WC 439]
MSKVLKLLSLLLVVNHATAVSLNRRHDHHHGRGQSDDVPSPPMTDMDTIYSTILQVEQKGGAEDAAPPSITVPPTVITAADGDITPAGQNSTALLEIIRSSESSANEARDIVVPGTGCHSGSGGHPPGHVERRQPHEHGSSGYTRKGGNRRTARQVPGYHTVFEGTGTGEGDRDAAIQGTAYLTYTVVSNATYNVDACLAHCSQVPGCVFANLYYEYNNELLDFVFSEKSNLKCALYGDVHTEAEKTNWGGQQSLPPPGDLTYIQHSSGYAADYADVATPYGYELVFGPTDGANNAPGYMGFALLDKYDTEACANLCNIRGSDGNGGVCQYFNIWRAVVNGVPTSYTCSMYYLPSDASTATNYGQGDLKVTYSRGYRRISFLPDGGFENLNCVGDCYFGSNNDWVGTSSVPGGELDAVVIPWAPWARTGHGVAVLGSLNGADTLPGKVETRNALATESGRSYKISFFHRSDRGTEQEQTDTWVDVLWNDQAVLSIRPRYQSWAHYEVVVQAQGGDRLAFRGGQAPAWSILDDAGVWAQ